MADVIAFERSESEQSPETVRQTPVTDELSRILAVAGSVPTDPLPPRPLQLFGTYPAAGIRRRPTSDGDCNLTDNSSIWSPPHATEHLGLPDQANRYSGDHTIRSDVRRALRGGSSEMHG
jgi:hypothetical protein